MDTIAGIDYSLSTPAICVAKNTEQFSFENCSFFYLTGTKKYACTWLKGKIKGNEHYIYKCPEQRYDNISQWAVDKVNHAGFIVIEDYAFAGKGRVFHIAENTGLLKYQLWRYKKPFLTVAPSAIKKFATGKGNADKEVMYQSWLAETSCDLKTMFETDKAESPISDIVDSFYMCKYAHKYLKEQN